MRKVAFWSSSDGNGRYPGLDAVSFIIEIEDLTNPKQVAVDRRLIARSDVNFYDWRDVTNTLIELETKFL